MTPFTPQVDHEHHDGDVFDTIQAFCRLVVPKASPHDGRNAMRGKKTGCPNIQFRAQGGRRMSIFSRISSRISYSDFTLWDETGLTAMFKSISTIEVWGFWHPPNMIITKLDTTATFF